MPSSPIHHRRLHNLLLIQKLLSLREGSSPFTLVLDTVEQSYRPLLKHYLKNAKVSKTSVIFISYETLIPPPGVTHMIKARRKPPSAIQQEISALCSPSQKTLLILDTLHPLSQDPSLHLPAFLSALLSLPRTTLIAIYHLDIPFLLRPSSSSNPYEPAPLTTLKYLSTTLLTLHSFSQVLAKKRCKERSLAETSFGLGEEREGVLVGFNDGGEKAGFVVEMEFRRKSGRGVGEWFFLPPVLALSSSSSSKTEGNKLILLDDHPLYNPLPTGKDGMEGNGEREEGEKGTFELGITDQQRTVREGVVLPYFDAQKGLGGGGGRILYDMGVEDDFDEEEDEI